VCNPFRRCLLTHSRQPDRSLTTPNCCFYVLLLHVSCSQANKTWLEHKLVGKVMGALHKIDYDTLAIERVGHVEYIVDPAACVPTEATAQAS